MLLSVLGMQSSISLSIAKIVEIIAQNTLGETASITAAGIEPLRDAWATIPASSRKAVVLYSDCPQSALIKLLIDSGAAAVLCLDDYPTVVGFQMANTGKGFIHSVRTAAMMLMPIEEIMQSDKLHIITPEKYDVPVTEILSDLIDFYRIPCSESQFSTILERVSYGAGTEATLHDFIAGQFPEWKSPSTALNALTRQDRKLMSDLGQTYTLITERRRIDEIYWHRQFFQNGDVPNRQLEGTTILTGPARYVFFGPYLHLPRGTWNAEVQIELLDCRSDTIAFADVFIGQTLNAVTMRFPRQGVYAFDLTFKVEDPLKNVEIRLHLLKGAIEGEMLLRGAKLTRILDESVMAKEHTLAVTQRQIGAD